MPKLGREAQARWIDRAVDTASMLRKLRRRFTMTEIAARCGVAETTVYRWSSGAAPRAERMVVLERMLPVRGKRRG